MGNRPRPKSRPSNDALYKLYDREIKGPVNLISEERAYKDGRLMLREAYDQKAPGGWYVVLKDANGSEEDLNNLEAVPWIPEETSS
jgi:hypothetical protein